MAKKWDAEYVKKDDGFSCLVKGCKRGPKGKDLIFSVKEIPVHLQEKHDIDYDDQRIDGWDDDCDETWTKFAKKRGLLKGSKDIRALDAIGMTLMVKMSDGSVKGYHYTLGRSLRARMIKSIRLLPPQHSVISKGLKYGPLRGRERDEDEDEDNGKDEEDEEEQKLSRKKLLKAGKALLELGQALIKYGKFESEEEDEDEDRDEDEDEDEEKEKKGKKDKDDEDEDEDDEDKDEDEDEDEDEDKDEDEDDDEDKEGKGDGEGPSKAEVKAFQKKHHLTDEETKLVRDWSRQEGLSLKDAAKDVDVKLK